MMRGASRRASAAVLVRRALRRAWRGRAVGAVEVPAEGAVVPPGRLRIAGWALPHRTMSRVEVRVGGRDTGWARPLAIPRPDVAQVETSAAAPLAGYEHVVTIDGEPGERVQIDVEMIDVTGARTPVPPLVFEIGASADDDQMEHSAVARELIVRRPSHPHEGPIRVVVFTHQLDVGGGQLYLQDVLRTLVPDPGFSCFVISAQDGSLRAELEALGADVHIVDYPVYSADDYENRVRLLEIIDQVRDADVALVNTMSAGLGADVAVRLGIPTVWTIHESFSLEDFWPAAYGDAGIPSPVRAAITRALANASALVFEADATRAVYAGVAPAERLVTLHYGVQVAAIDCYRENHDRAEVRSSLGFGPDAQVLLCMGTFEPRKAQGALVMAFAEIASVFPDAVLALVGDNTMPYADGVREVVARLGLGDRIRIEPVVAEAYPWYFAADVFVIASDIESMPRTLLEAMGFGVPVAAASAWGVPELIHDGENGVLFQPRDVGLIAAALRRMLALAPEERARLGAAGARTVAEHHDVSGYVEALRRLLGSLARDPDAVPRQAMFGGTDRAL